MIKSITPKIKKIQSIKTSGYNKIMEKYQVTGTNWYSTSMTYFIPDKTNNENSITNEYHENNQYTLNYNMFLQNNIISKKQTVSQIVSNTINSQVNRLIYNETKLKAIKKNNINKIKYIKNNNELANTYKGYHQKTSLETNKDISLYITINKHLNANDFNRPITAKNTKNKFDDLTKSIIYKNANIKNYMHLIKTEKDQSSKYLKYFKLIKRATNDKFLNQLFSNKKFFNLLKNRKEERNQKILLYEDKNLLNNKQDTSYLSNFVYENQSIDIENQKLGIQNQKTDIQNQKTNIKNKINIIPFNKLNHKPAEEFSYGNYINKFRYTNEFHYTDINKYPINKFISKQWEKVFINTEINKNAKVQYHNILYGNTYNGKNNNYTSDSKEYEKNTNTHKEYIKISVTKPDKLVQQKNSRNFHIMRLPFTEKYANTIKIHNNYFKKIKSNLRYNRIKNIETILRSNIIALNTINKHFDRTDIQHESQTVNKQWIHLLLKYANNIKTNKNYEVFLKNHNNHNINKNHINDNLTNLRQLLWQNRKYAKYITPKRINEEYINKEYINEEYINKKYINRRDIDKKDINKRTINLKAIKDISIKGVKDYFANNNEYEKTININENYTNLNLMNTSQLLQQVDNKILNLMKIIFTEKFINIIKAHNNYFKKAIVSNSRYNKIRNLENIVLNKTGQYLNIKRTKYELQTINHNEQSFLNHTTTTTITTNNKNKNNNYQRTLINRTDNYQNTLSHRIDDYQEFSPNKIFNYNKGYYINENNYVNKKYTNQKNINQIKTSKRYTDQKNIFKKHVKNIVIQATKKHFLNNIKNNQTTGIYKKYTKIRLTKSDRFLQQGIQYELQTLNKQWLQLHYNYPNNIKTNSIQRISSNNFDNNKNYNLNSNYQLNRNYNKDNDYHIDRRHHINEKYIKNIIIQMIKNNSPNNNGHELPIAIYKNSSNINLANVSRTLQLIRKYPKIIQYESPTFNRQLGYYLFNTTGKNKINHQWMLLNNKDIHCQSILNIMNLKNINKSLRQDSKNIIFNSKVMFVVEKLANIIKFNNYFEEIIKSGSHYTRIKNLKNIPLTRINKYINVEGIKPKLTTVSSQWGYSLFNIFNNNKINNYHEILVNKKHSYQGNSLNKTDTYREDLPNEIYSYQGELLNRTDRRKEILLSRIYSYQRNLLNRADSHKGSLINRTIHHGNLLSRMNSYNGNSLNIIDSHHRKLLNIINSYQENLLYKSQVLWHNNERKNLYSKIDNYKINSLYRIDDYNKNHYISKKIINEKNISENDTNKAGTNKAGTNKAGTNKAGTNKVGTNKVSTNKISTNKASINKADTNKTDISKININNIIIQKTKKHLIKNNEYKNPLSIYENYINLKLLKSSEIFPQTDNRKIANPINIILLKQIANIIKGRNKYLKKTITSKASYNKIETLEKILLSKINKYLNIKSIQHESQVINKQWLGLDFNYDNKNQTNSNQNIVLNSLVKYNKSHYINVNSLKLINTISQLSAVSSTKLNNSIKQLSSMNSEKLINSVNQLNSMNSKNQPNSMNLKNRLNLINLMYTSQILWQDEKYTKASNLNKSYIEVNKKHQIKQISVTKQISTIKQLMEIKQYLNPKSTKSKSQHINHHWNHSPFNHAKSNKSQNNSYQEILLNAINNYNKSHDTVKKPYINKLLINEHYIDKNRVKNKFISMFNKESINSMIMPIIKKISVSSDNDTKNLEIYKKDITTYKKDSIAYKKDITAYKKDITAYKKDITTYKKDNGVFKKHISFYAKYIIAQKKHPKNQLSQYLNTKNIYYKTQDANKNLRYLNNTSAIYEAQKNNQQLDYQTFNHSQNNGGQKNSQQDILLNIINSYNKSQDTLKKHYTNEKNYISKTSINNVFISRFKEANINSTIMPKIKRIQSQSQYINQHWNDSPFNHVISNRSQNNNYQEVLLSVINNYNKNQKHQPIHSYKQNTDFLKDLPQQRTETAQRKIEEKSITVSDVQKFTLTHKKQSDYKKEESISSSSKTKETIDLLDELSQSTNHYPTPINQQTNATGIIQTQTQTQKTIETTLNEEQLLTKEQLPQIVDMVYDRIEKRLKIERSRRGMI